MATDYARTEANFYQSAKGGKKCAGIVDGTLHCLVRFVLKGFFNTSTILGYTQFMIYVVLRMIILGSLFGGLFRNEDDITCPTRSEITNYSALMLPGNASKNMKYECLRIFYYNGLSPLHFWALSLLTAAIPWLIMLPWTPTGPEQENSECASGKCKWPYLTVYMSAFMRTIFRAFLEALFAVLSVVIYKSGFVEKKLCIINESALFCNMHLYEEKSYVVWMLFFVNVFCCFLSTAEIIDMCRNTSKYTEESKITMKVARRLSRLASLDSTTIIGSLKIEKNPERNERKRRMATTRLRACKHDENCPGKFSKNRLRKKQEHAPDEMVALIVTTPQGDTLINNNKILERRHTVANSTASMTTDHTTVHNEDVTV